MEFAEIPRFLILHGEEAIESLYDFIKEFQEERSAELTDKQVRALIKLAKGLICSIEGEFTGLIKSAHDGY